MSIDKIDLKKLAAFAEKLPTMSDQDLQMIYQNPDGFIKQQKNLVLSEIVKPLSTYLHTVSPDKANLETMRKSITALSKIINSGLLPGIGSTISHTDYSDTTQSNLTSPAKIWKKKDWTNLEHEIAPKGSSPRCLVQVLDKDLKLKYLLIDTDTGEEITWLDNVDVRFSKKYPDRIITNDDYFKEIIDAINGRCLGRTNSLDRRWVDWD